MIVYKPQITLVKDLKPYLTIRGALIGYSEKFLTFKVCNEKGEKCNIFRFLKSRFWDESKLLEIQAIYDITLLMYKKTLVVTKVRKSTSKTHWNIGYIQGKINMVYNDEYGTNYVLENGVEILNPAGKFKNDFLEENKKEAMRFSITVENTTVEYKDKNEEVREGQNPRICFYGTETVDDALEFDEETLIA